MSDALSSRIGPTINKIMGPVHTDIFQKDGTWKPGDWFTAPAGIQRLTVSGRSDLFPSWYNKSQVNPTDKVTFDKVSKKKATDCTPESAKETVDVQKFTDPITKKTTYISPSGYDANSSDDLHKCDDVKPYVTTITKGPGKKITANVSQGTHALQTVVFTVNGQEVGSLPANGSGAYTIDYTGPSSGSVTVTVTDVALYSNALTNSL